MQPVRWMMAANAAVDLGHSLPVLKTAAAAITPAVARPLAGAIDPAAHALQSLRDLQPVAALDALRGASIAASGTSALDDALRAGRLLRTGQPAKLDALEQLLRTGVTKADGVSARVGAGINGELHAHILHNTADSSSSVVAVAKSLNAQAAQEEYGWKLGRAMGIDHLLAPTARDASGRAQIALAPGTSLSHGGITDVGKLEAALTASYTSDTALHLSAADAARAGRIDRELLQFFDYLGVNNDRHLGNGLIDAATNRITFIDYGFMGTGTGKNPLVPSLRAFQSRERIELSQDTLDILRKRLTPDVLDEVHATLNAGPPPAAGSMSARTLSKVTSPQFRHDVDARLQHVLETGGFSSASSTDVAMPQVAREMEPRGPHGMMFGGDGMGGFGGFDRF